jgi:signal transduction histidine kinase
MAIMTGGIRRAWAALGAPWPPRKRRRREDRAALAEAAAEAFEVATVLLENSGARLITGQSALAICARALDIAPPSAEAVIRALARLDPDHALALGALAERGAPCAFDSAGPRGRLRVTGRASGALAWVSLSPHPARDDGGDAGRAALELYPHPAWIVDGAGEILMANRAWLAAVEAPDLAAARARGLVFDSAADDLARTVIATGEAGERVRWLSLPQGRRAMRIWAEPAPGGGAAVWTTDITDARSASRAARLQAETLDLILSQVSDAVAVFDVDHRLARHNPAFAALWDLEPAWLAERPRHGEWLDRLRHGRRLTPSEDYATFKSRELERHGRAEASETIWRLPEGRTLRVASAPHPDGGVILVLSDITDELRIKTQFNHLLQVQQATLDKLTDAVAVFGSDARLKLHNEAFQTLWRLPATALAHAPHFDDLVEFCVARLHDMQFWRDLKGRIADPDPHIRAPAAGEAVTGDGRRLAWQSRPLPDGATLVGFADVTTARQIEEALRDRQDALDEAERLKREFVSAVSRELRTPLTTILGYAELLDHDDEGLEAKARERVGAIRSAASVLARAIEDILDIAELDAGEVGLILSEVEVSALLASAAARWASRAAGAGVSLSAADVTAGIIRADGRKLAKVMDHLIDNAIAHTPAGGAVTLSAARAAGEVNLRVSDTGPVIPYVIQARIFERHAGEDTGAARLSLALVKSLVELHGGWVTVESGPGAGAAFTCHLPESATGRDGLT